MARQVPVAIVDYEDSACGDLWNRAQSALISNQPVDQNEVKFPVPDPLQGLKIFTLLSVGQLNTYNSLASQLFNNPIVPDDIMLHAYN
jgi:hypothetical protein